MKQLVLVFFLFALTLSAQGQLKAVVVVGPTESFTQTQINEAKQIAEVLEKHGITVHTFYHPNAKWEAITAAASNAHYLVYLGHGLLQADGITPGGWVLSEPQFILNDRIASEMTLAPNALVLMQSVCYATGASSTDKTPVKAKVALDRALAFSSPFLNQPIAGYVAINTVGGIVTFLNNFFSDKSLSTAFKATMHSGLKTVVDQPLSGYNYQCIMAENTYAFNILQHNATNGRHTITSSKGTTGIAMLLIGKPDFMQPIPNELH